MLGGRTDKQFIKLASQYNDLVENGRFRFRIADATGASSADDKTIDYLWALETCYGSGDGTRVRAGSGFMLAGVGLVTCAHCVLDDDKKPFLETKAYQGGSSSNDYTIKVRRSDWHRDIAICELVPQNGETVPRAAAELSHVQIARDLPLTILGFPDYGPGKEQHYAAKVVVTRKIVWGAVDKFEINSAINKGTSGGPLIDADGRVVGMAVEGVTNGSGVNAALSHVEIRKYVETVEDPYEVEASLSQ